MVQIGQIFISLYTALLTQFQYPTASSFRPTNPIRISGEPHNLEAPGYHLEPQIIWALLPPLTIRMRTKGCVRRHHCRVVTQFLIQERPASEGLHALEAVAVHKDTLSRERGMHAHGKSRSTAEDALRMEVHTKCLIKLTRHS